MRYTLLIAVSLLASCSQDHLITSTSLATTQGLDAVWAGRFEAAREALDRLQSIETDPASCRESDLENWSAYQVGVGLKELIPYAQGGASKAQLVAIARSEVLERQENIVDRNLARCNVISTTHAGDNARATVRQWVEEGQRESGTWEADLAQAEADYRIVRWNKRIRECSDLRQRLNAPPESRSSSLVRRADQDLYHMWGCSRMERDQPQPHPNGFPRQAGSGR
jgi:hypothetical protein